MSKILDDNTDIRKLQTGESNRKIDSLELLKNAIIIRAVKDYCKVLKIEKKRILDTGEKYTKKECEEFFKSQRFEMLSDVDGNFLIKKLQEMIDNDDDKVKSLIKG